MILRQDLCTHLPGVMWVGVTLGDHRNGRHPVLSVASCVLFNVSLSALTNGFDAE